MPFTFAHPAVVLPLLGLTPRYLSLTGLIIGSIAPDFEYFLRLQVKSTHSHTLVGIFYFDLPLTFILAFVFHLIIRKPLLTHLPQFLYNRLAQYVDVDWVSYSRKHSVKVLLSSLIGIGSHVLWDSFTHQTGYFAMLIPFFHSEVYLSGFIIPVYKILQHLSTIIGFVVIAAFVYRLPILYFGKMPEKLYFWPVIGFTTLAFILISIGNSFQVGQMVIYSISGLMAGILIASLLVRNYYII